MLDNNSSLKSGIRDNLRRGTVYEFLEQEIKTRCAWTGHAHQRHPLG